LHANIYKHFLKDSRAPERGSRDQHSVKGETTKGLALSYTLYLAPQTWLSYRQSIQPVRSSHGQERALRLRFLRGQAIDRRVALIYLPDLRYYTTGALAPASIELSLGRASSPLKHESL